MIETQGIQTIMKMIPDIEEPRITATQTMILNYLKDQRFPKLAKTISIVLNLNYDSTRARLHELSSMGLVCQPNRGLLIADLPLNGQSKVTITEKKCGYSIVTRA